MADKSPPEPVPPTVAETVERIAAYQRLGAFHPLTCAIGGGMHADLVPAEEDGILVLACPTCGARQTDGIPPSAYALSIRQLEEHAAPLHGRRSTPPEIRGIFYRIRRLG